MIRTCLAALALAGAMVCAGAAELRVLGTGAVQHSVIEAIPGFEKETGHKVIADFGTAGAVAARLAKGESADLYLSSQGGIRDMIAKGQAVAGAPLDLGMVRIGIGVRSGAAKPDISTPEKLKALLLSAPSFAYGDPASGATTGIHFARIIEGFGIGAQVKDKALLRNGGLNVMKEVADGKAMYGFTQSSEILAVKGTEIAGYLPDALQLVTVYSGQVGAKAADPALARQFLDYLAGPKGAEIFAHHGFERVKK